MPDSNKEIINDEIDLFKIIKIIWRRKYWIASFVIIVSVASVFYAKSLDNIYQSSALLKPTKNTAENSSLSRLKEIAGFTGMNLGEETSINPYYIINAIISDKTFLADFVKSNKLEKNIFEDYEEMAG